MFIEWFQNDIGGLRYFVNKWVSFVKVRLVCLEIGKDGSEIYFDELGTQI